MSATPDPVSVELRRQVDRAHLRLGNVSIDRMQGDNLAVTLCSHFDDAEGEQDDNGWTEAATAGYEETVTAIRQHYEPVFAEILDTLAASQKRIGELEAESARHRQAGIAEGLERAAKVAENYDDTCPRWGKYSNQAVAEEAAKDIAAAIRSLSEEGVSK